MPGVVVIMKNTSIQLLVDPDDEVTQVIPVLTMQEIVYGECHAAIGPTRPTRDMRPLRPATEPK